MYIYKYIESFYEAFVQSLYDFLSTSDMACHNTLYLKQNYGELIILLYFGDGCHWILLAFMDYIDKMYY